MSSTLDITLQGREYRVACPPAEFDALAAAAALLDSKMSEVAEATKSTGERLAVMTALNLAYELNTARQEMTSTSAVPSKSLIDAEATMGRIITIEARLAAALARQNEPL